MAASSNRRTFTVVMIKPSRYDLDGYPIVWMKSVIPSNTLAAMYGIVEDANQRRVLGSDVDIDIVAIDECNTRIQPRRLIAQITRHGGSGVLFLTGVQSNQFPRAVDIAQPFLDAGVPVVLGGFHVSGCFSMLPETPPEIAAAMDAGISMFTGEAEEGRVDEVLQDAQRGELKPLYDYVRNLPSLENAPLPFLPLDVVGRTIDKRSSVDLGRGCPFQCSFCTIINVQGRKSRFRTPDDLERIVRDNAAQGIGKFFITDDNIARNRLWEAFFDRLIKLRKEEGITVSLIIQVDTQCHKINGFIEKARAAGVQRVFIGLENINPDNLMAAKKRQNKITDYRIMLQKWREVGCFIWAGYILGFPADTKETILRDIDIIKRELPIDMLEIFCLTPLPGSEDHKVLLAKGEWMDPDLNKYNTHHRVTHHPRMSDREWEEAYDAAWRRYYTPEHIETVARRRAALHARNPLHVVKFMAEFKSIYEIEDLHPLEGGLVRLRYRLDRRPGMPIEWPGLFHLKLAASVLRRIWSYGRILFMVQSISRKVRKDPNRRDYMDTAIAPCADSEQEDLSLFKDTTGAAEALAHERVIAQVKANARKKGAHPTAA